MAPKSPDQAAPEGSEEAAVPESGTASGDMSVLLESMGTKLMLQIEQGQARTEARLAALESGRSQQTASDEAVTDPTLASEDEATLEVPQEESGGADVGTMAPAGAEVVKEALTEPEIWADQLISTLDAEVQGLVGHEEKFDWYKVKDFAWQGENKNDFAAFQEFLREFLTKLRNYSSLGLDDLGGVDLKSRRDRKWYPGEIRGMFERAVPAFFKQDLLNSFQAQKDAVSDGGMTARHALRSQVSVILALQKVEFKNHSHRVMVNAKGCKQNPGEDPKEFFGRLKLACEKTRYAFMSQHQATADQQEEWARSGLLDNFQTLIRGNAVKAFNFEEPEQIFCKKYHGCPKNCSNPECGALQYDHLWTRINGVNLLSQGGQRQGGQRHGGGSSGRRQGQVNATGFEVKGDVADYIEEHFGDANSIAAPKRMPSKDEHRAVKARLTPPEGRCFGCFATGHRVFNCQHRNGGATGKSWAAFVKMGKPENRA
jgi:hypothetical protein